MKILGFAFMWFVFAITCNTERSFQYEERMTFKEVYRTFIIGGKPSQAVSNLRKSGHAVNCGPTGMKMNITWTPEPIIAGKNVDFFVSVDPVVGLTSAAIDGKIYLGDVPKGDPILQETLTMTCTKAKKSIPALKCPIQKGVPIEGRYLLLAPQLPEGLYTIVANITNESNKLFACIQLTVRLQMPGK